MASGSSSVTQLDDTLSGNYAQGGTGGNGGNGGNGANGRYRGGSGGNGGTGGTGGTGMGGGIHVAQGSVTMTNLTFSGSDAQGGLGGVGGAGGNGGNGSTIAGGVGGAGGNGGAAGAGGSAAGGGLYVAASSATLINDTLSRNSAQGGLVGVGGAGGNGGNAGAADGNSGNAGVAGGNGAGGGLFVLGGSTTTLANTLIAENTARAGTGGGSALAGSASDPDVSGTVASSNHDLIGNNSGFSAAASNGDILNPAFVGLDANDLQNNDGPLVGAAGSQQVLQTIALVPGSPAIGGGDISLSGLPSTDERGQLRFHNNALDIGAFQTQGFTLTVSSSSNNQSALIDTPFANPLVVAVKADDGFDPVAGGQVTFTAPSSGASAALNPASPVTIAANGTASVNATANGTAGSYNVTSSAAGADSPATISLTNQPAPTTTTLTSSANPSVYGQTVTFTATVSVNSSSSGTPTGTVTFYDGSTQLGTGTLSVVNGQDVATYTTTASQLAVGSNQSITASYAGDGNYSLSGASGSITVTPRLTTVTADPQSKTVGTADPSLAYQVTAGNLVGTDTFSGSLTRDPGEAAGAYTIRQGSLTAGPNYTLSFVNSVLIITAANDSLQSGQTVGVSSTAGSSTAATTPSSSGAPQLSATGSGFDGALTVAQYTAAPVNGFSASGSYFDINVGSSNLGTSSSVQVVFTNLTPGATVFWLNGNTWQAVTDASGRTVTADASGTATVTLTTNTSPTLAQLTGSYFFAGTFQPTLTVAAGATTAIGTGVPLAATATLTGGDNPAGSITFTLYDPSGNKVDTETVSVAGNGTYATPNGFVPTVAGTYQWLAAYTSSNSFNANASTRQSDSEVAVGTGVKVVGSTLWIVGGATTNDNVQLNPVGTSNTGSTGIQVDANLNHVHTTTTYTQSFTVLYIYLFGGNENIQLAKTLAINATIGAGNGNDNVQLGNGNDTVTLGSGNDNVQAGDGNNTIAVGNGNDKVQLGNGNNTITTGNGNDNVQVGNGNNVVVAGNGNNKIQAGNGDNLIAGGLGHDNIQAGNGNNILIDGSVSLPIDTLLQVLGDWIDYGSTKNGADLSYIDSALLGSVMLNNHNANTLHAGSGFDWFWATDAKENLNVKKTDMLN